jgi:hypothetical protein
MHDIVQDGRQLQHSDDLKTSACCDTGQVPAWLKPLLARIHPTCCRAITVAAWSARPCWKAAWCWISDAARDAMSTRWRNWSGPWANLTSKFIAALAVPPQGFCAVAPALMRDTETA